MLRSLKRLLTVLLVGAGLAPPAVAQSDSFADFALFTNSDPGALAMGIWFDAPVPMSVRRVILDDLLWLAALGDLKESDEIASALGLGPSVSGADLVAWLLLHVRGISATPSCVESPTILIDDADLLRAPATEAAGIDVLQRCDGFSSRFWAFVEYNPYTPRAIARYFDDHVLLSRETTFPVIHLGSLFMRERGSGIDDRAARLVTLFHEAHHIAFGSNHYSCSRLNLLGLTREFGRRGTLLNGFGNNCDVGMRSAYFLEGLFAELLLANCDSCDEAEARNIRFMATRAYLRVQIPLSTVQRVDAEGFFMARHPSSIAIQYIPPERFFELQSLTYAEELGRVPPWFVELKTIAEDVAAAGGYVDEPWQQRPAAAVVVDPDLAMHWLAAANDHATDGYNVPLAYAPPCDQTPIGCREGWWDRIEPLENGLPLIFMLGPGTEVKLARIDVDMTAPDRLTLSVDGDGHGALLYICHVESSRCVMRVVEDDGEIIRWPDAEPGSYAVWIDGFGTEAAAPGALPLSVLARW